jgi:asparagine synthase (glutamine-hydrolysing)
MTSMVALLHPRGEPVQEAALRARLARLEPEPGAVTRRAVLGPFAAVAQARRGEIEHLIARRRALIAMGSVRLDNRQEVAGWSRAATDGASDLAVVLAAIEARGTDCLAEVLGDFSLVVWDARAHKLVAARDAFGVRPLFYRADGAVLALSNRLGLLAEEERYDGEFAAAFLQGGRRPTDRTIWADCRAVGAGCMLVQRGTVRSVRRYWDPAAFEPHERVDEGEAAERFRELFREAVRLRATGGGETWAQLSGGLDSSAVVATAQELAGAGVIAGGLGGTVTVVDSLGEGDERRYSDAVVQRYGLRNETIADYWAWQDDERLPPRTEEPWAFYPFFARDRRMYEAVRAGGGRILLSGLGADHYLSGDASYVADLARSGRLGEAAGEVARWAVATRGSFWKIAGRYGALPLLPPAVQRRFGRPPRPPVAWLEPALEVGPALPSAGRGGIFARKIAAQVAALPGSISRVPAEAGIEMRYPFLYRPLVEFSLRLPATLRVRPGAQKWVLRQALRDTLPAEVLSRRGKGGIDSRLLWSLERERHRLAELLRSPHTADLGWIRPAPLRAAVESARCGNTRDLAPLLCALSLETWMAVRAGRWLPARRLAETAA